MNKYIGVLYVYAQSAFEPNLSQTEAFSLNSETVAILPTDWLVQPDQATIE